jgi:cytochrome c biogenesis protein CcdA/peroxiredoxin
MNVTAIGLAFLEGFVLIVSPCILPILPIVLSVGVTGGKQRPYGIMLGFIIAFCVFTLLSRYLILFLGINSEILRQISFVLLLLLGLVMISTYLTEKFNQLTQTFAKAGEKLTQKKEEHDNFWNGLLLGLPIGLIWTPCAGPIIAVVLIETIRQQTNLGTILILLAFSLGVAVPMLLLILFGKRLVTELTFFKKHSILLRKILGVIIILTVIITAQGSLFTFSNSTGVLGSVRTVATTKNTPTVLINSLMQPYPAPAIAGITDWINSPPLTIQSLKGKVVLIDFWTYSCINCLRTLPYLKAWYRQYHDQGLVIIGVHSPEFAFEQIPSNVKAAVARYGITYPVALDNNFVTWTNYHNHYWPAHYLIDKNGNVVYIHFGEGAYAETENNIRLLLGANTIISNVAPAKTGQEGTWMAEMSQTPETYLGFARGQRMVEKHIKGKQDSNYIFPSVLVLHHWALQGQWKQSKQKITALSTQAAIKLHFHAKKVFLVMGSTSNQPVSVVLYLNGKPIANVGGHDVQNSQLTVQQHALYELVNLPHSESAILEIKTLTPGFEAYAFTFGS